MRFASAARSAPVGATSTRNRWRSPSLPASSSAATSWPMASWVSSTSARRAAFPPPRSCAQALKPMSAMKKTGPRTHVTMNHLERAPSVYSRRATTNHALDIAGPSGRTAIAVASHVVDEDLVERRDAALEAHDLLAGVDKLAQKVARATSRL